MKKVILVLSVCAALVAIGDVSKNTNVKQLECARKISVEVGLPMALAAEEALLSFLI